MAQIQAAIDPAGAYSMTTAPTQSVAQPNSSLMQLYQEIIRRRAASPVPVGAPASGYAAPAPVRAGVTAPYKSPTQRAEEERRMQEERNQQAYENQIRAIDLNPPKKYIESRPGIQGGYADDVSVLPLSMRPKEAGITMGPQNTAKAQAQLNDDQVFQAKLDKDRARTANGNMEY